MTGINNKKKGYAEDLNSAYPFPVSFFQTAGSQSPAHF